jgi:hypothetical protein
VNRLSETNPIGSFPALPGRQARKKISNLRKFGLIDSKEKTTIMKLVLIGAAGYLGKIVLNEALAHGYQVTA